MVSSAEYAAPEFTKYIVQWCTRKRKIIFKKGPKTHKIQDGGMFTWKFKMAAIFVKLYKIMSLPIHRYIDLSKPLRIYRDSIF